MNLSKRLKDLWSYKGVLREMSQRELKAKYSGSMLGLWWAIVLPVLLAVSINFVFLCVYKVRTERFPLFLLSGIIPWTFFSAALMEAAVSFLAHRSELRQGIFPRACVPVASVAANFLNFLIGFLVLLPLFLVSEPRVLGALLFLPLVLCLHFFFVLGLGILFAAVNVFWRDLSHLLSVGMMAWFWMTPVFYRPEDLDFPYRWVCLVNPMTPFIVSYRKVLFSAEMPSGPLLASCAALSLLALGAGYAFYVRKEPQLLKKI